MTQIVIVGTAGAGKTTLATVWAQKLSDSLGDVFLTANDAKRTIDTAKAWDTLCNKGEWLPPTVGGPGFELQWILHLKQQKVPVKLINFAGQDLRQLFSADRFKDPNLPDNERETLRYVQSSDIIVLVVNMADYIGEEEYAKRTENENRLASVIQLLTESGRMSDILLVFTAYDQHRSAIKAKSGSFEKYLKKELTSLYNACRASGNRIDVQTIAAVAETETKTDKDSGQILRFPKKGFRSFGLNSFTNWICESVARRFQTNQWVSGIQSDSPQVKQLLSGIQSDSPQENRNTGRQMNENKENVGWQSQVNAYPAVPQESGQEMPSRVNQLLSTIPTDSTQGKSTIGGQHKNEGCLWGCIGGGIGGGIGLSINGWVGLIIGVWIGFFIGGMLGLWDEENTRKNKNKRWRGIGMVIGLFIVGGVVGSIWMVVGKFIWVWLSSGRY